MSRFGETADIILEMLMKRETISKLELKRKLSLADTKVIDFLEDYGLIELNMDYVSITQSGKEFLAVK